MGLIFSIFPLQMLLYFPLLTLCCFTIF